MTGTQTLIARAALGLLAATCSVVLASSARLVSLVRRSFDRTVTAAFVLSRLGIFGLIFFILRIPPRGDIPAYYLFQAQQVLHHLLPYRDFVSSYAPLHPYLDALLLTLWPTPLSLILFPILIECCLIPIWLSIGRTFAPEADLRLAALLYLASPIGLQFVVVDGQDNVVIAVLSALALLLLLRSRTLLSGLLMAVPVVVIKFLPLLYAPAFFLAARRRWRWTAAFASLIFVVYGACLLRHLPVLQPLLSEGAIHTAGDLPYLLEALFGLTIPGRLSDAFLLTVLAAIFFLIARALLAAPAASADYKRDSVAASAATVVAHAFAALTLALLLFSKKSWPPYLMLALFPICLLVTPARSSHRRLKIAAFALFSFVAVTEHSVWSSLLLQPTSDTVHTALLALDARAILFIALEVALIAGYIWLLLEALRGLLRPPHVEHPIQTP